MGAKVLSLLDTYL